MSKVIVLFGVLLPFVLCVSRKELVEFAVKQYTRVAQTTKTGVEYPWHGVPTSDKWILKGPKKFESGMYPGILWQLYHHTGENSWKDLAIKATDGMYENQFNTYKHDIGFEIDNSYGLGYDLTHNQSYSKIIINAGTHAASRFNYKVGCIRSWDNSEHKPKYPEEFQVIVDNMMNLELLFRAHLLSGNNTFYEMAVSHTNKTIENHLRKDFSSYHVVSFNETDGKVISKHTAQGYSDESCWSRGQAWLINGFMTAYKYTNMTHILEAAKNVANYYVDNLPEDGIPYWDFNVPKNKYPYIPRDTSSAAAASSGLFELYIHTNNTKYLSTAKKIMDSLFSSKYRADGKKEYKIPALIVNGTGGGPNAAEGLCDMALSYGDYYFVESFKYLD